MDKGTIVFHNDKHIFDDMLRELGVSEKSLCLSDAKFLSLPITSVNYYFTNYSMQTIYGVMYASLL